MNNGLIMVDKKLGEEKQYIAFSKVNKDKPKTIKISGFDKKCGVNIEEVNKAKALVQFKKIKFSCRQKFIHFLRCCNYIDNVFVKLSHSYIHIAGYILDGYDDIKKLYILEDNKYRELPISYSGR